jgi:hypothetical protein
MDKQKNFEEYILDTLSKNLVALEEYFPDLFEKFKDYKEERYHFVYDSDGAFNIYDTKEERNLYPEDPLSFSSKVFSEYKKEPVHYSKAFSITEGISAKVNPVHSRAVNKLAHLKVLQAQLSSGQSIELKDKISSIFFTDVGLGHDLEHVFLNYNVFNSIIIEPDADIFYASLFVCRWYDIFERQEKNGWGLSLYVGFEESQMYGLFHEHFYGMGRFKNNGIYVYSPIDIRGESYYQLIADYVQSALLEGFGFYDDSLYSIAASIHNTENKVPIYVNSEKSVSSIEMNKDVPVFLIGAGPSLDADLEFIKKYQDKAFVISCGSGVKSLEVHGIQPDLHVECERTAITTHWLEQVSPGFLKNTAFLGLNVVHPEIYDRFKCSGMMVKGLESGSMLMAQQSKEMLGEEILPLATFVNPTVVHMGVGVFPFLGFRKAYLFGADMGYKDPENHHSSSSSYSDITDEYKEKLVAKKSFSVESNFSGSEILSDDVYTGFRMFLEKEIAFLDRAFFGLECFNCSDGAAIKNAKPFPAEDLSYLDKAKSVNKNQIVSDIFDNFFEVQEELGEAIHQKLRNDIPEIVSICREMESRYSKEYESIEEYQAIVDENNRYLFQNEKTIIESDAYLMGLFSGSLLYYLSALNSIVYYPAMTEERNIELSQAGMAVIAGFFKEVADTFEDTYLKVDNADLYDYFG